MPHLVSLPGLMMTVKHVSNWYSVVALYTGILSKTTVKFKDGKRIALSKNNYVPFREKIYREYLKDKGFRYDEVDIANPVIKTKNGLRIILLPNCSNVIDEIFVRNCYGVKDLTGRDVIDIGVFIGDSSLYFATRGASKIFGYEVDPDLYRMALKNIEINNLSDRIHIYNKEANSKTVQALLYEAKMTNVFMKLDCEGCEYEIFENIDSKIFEKVTDVAMEYHKQPNPLVQRLRSLGFRVHYRKHILYPEAEGMIFAKRI